MHVFTRNSKTFRNIQKKKKKKTVENIKSCSFQFTRNSSQKNFIKNKRVGG